VVWTIFIADHCPGFTRFTGATEVATGRHISKSKTSPGLRTWWVNHGPVTATFCAAMAAFKFGQAGPHDLANVFARNRDWNQCCELWLGFDDTKRFDHGYSPDLDIFAEAGFFAHFIQPTWRAAHASVVERRL
jgi:hypothetical protein